MTEEEIIPALTGALSMTEFKAVVDQHANVTVPDAAEALARVRDAENLLRLLAAVQDCRRLLQWAESEVASQLAPLVPWKTPLVVEGVGSAERSMSGKKTRWDVPGALRGLIQRSIVDPETGEIDPNTRELAETVLDEILAVAQVAYLRKTALKEKGLNPALYAEEEGGTPTVIFRRAGSDA